TYKISHKERNCYYRHVNYKNCPSGSKLIVIVQYFLHHYIVFFLIISVTNCKSLSDKLDPLGKQSPISNNFSETPFVNDLQSLKTGCKCKGFHKGLDSMFSASNASLIFSLSS